MAETDSGERTEEATPRKREEARKKGQIPRSRELDTALLLLVGGIGCLSFGRGAMQTVAEITRYCFDLKREQIFLPERMPLMLGESFGHVFLAVLPILILLLVVALAAPILLGGWVFNWDSASPRFDRLSPLKGFSRMFGVHAAVELLKSFAKFFVVAGFATIILWIQFDEFMSLGRASLEGSVAHGLDLLAWSFIGISAAMILIAAIDVPYQLWSYAKQLRMTKQEVRDEYKESEGRPEVKGRIRQLQREMARRRMMQQVPQADVVVTNPDHYAVALQYNPLGRSAPKVIAKGADLIALQIKKLAAESQVPVVEAPPLARAIYFTTELDREIPEGLYLAVAQLLAYVYQLRNWRNGRGGKPKEPGEYPIPDALRH
ncbi:MAG: flagellar type III secretion system protein FlhB [Gammaproteobacteria bacterium]|nr:flagellar type III secretion system protein FlhB [Gammaproteobacteria bacterium]